MGNSTTPASTAAATPCLLTKKGGGNFDSKPGKLTFSVHNQHGMTTFNEEGTTVEVDDGTGNFSVIPFEITDTTLSFQVEEGRYYMVEPLFTQSAGVGVVADVNELCGLRLDTIDILNLEPTWWVQA